MDPVLVDSNVLIDVATEDPHWGDWSSEALERAADEAVLVINPIVYAEVSVAYDRVEDLEQALPPEAFRRDALPYAAGFLAGKALRRLSAARRRPDHTAARLLHRGPRGHRGLPAVDPRRGTARPSPPSC